MRISLGVVGFLLAGLVFGQLEVPVGIVLSGSADGDRQITGLGDPSIADAAVSVEASRAGSMSFTSTTGSVALSGSLVPAPSVYTLGMSLIIVPEMANGPGATLELNGLGARPILKFGQAPLDSADLPVGMPARLVYDGNSFLLLNTVSRPCRTGMRAAGSIYCISDSALGIGTFFESIAACASRGLRLCSFGEWAAACKNRPGFFGTVTQAEWVDDAANNSGDAKVVGAGSNGQVPLPGTNCGYGNTRSPTLTASYRCCSDR